MKKIFILLFPLLLTNCKPTDKNEIPLFNLSSFKLLENETLKKSSTVDSKFYFEYVKNKRQEIPLFKHIQHPDYTIYLGLPLNSSILELSEQTYSLSNSDSVYSKTYKDSLNYITESAIRIDKNIIFMLSVSSKKELQDSILKAEALRARIVKK